MSIATRRQDRHCQVETSNAMEWCDSGDAVMEQAARLLAGSPERDWRLDELAALVHLSVSQLGRAFTRRFDMPPMRYLAHVRAHRLAKLLMETDLPIGDAMNRVGWRSRGHAARQFTAIIGVTPSEYRRTAHSVARDPAR